MQRTAHPTVVSRSVCPILLRAVENWVMGGAAPVPRCRKFCRGLSAILVYLVVVSGRSWKYSRELDCRLQLIEGAKYVGCFEVLTGT